MKSPQIFIMSFKDVVLSSRSHQKDGTGFAGYVSESNMCVPPSIVTSNAANAECVHDPPLMLPILRLLWCMNSLNFRKTLRNSQSLAY